MNNFSSILERLSSRAKNALIAAQLSSEELKHDHIGTEHLLLGVVSEKSSFAAEILNKTKLTPEIIKQELILVNSNNKISAWKPVLSDNLKSVIERAAIIASQYGYQFIGTEHFLYGLLTVNQSKAKVILSKLSVDAFELEQNLLNVFENISKFPEIPEGTQGPAGMSAGPIPPQANRKEKNLLEYFTTDITKKASDGLVDPVVGRKKEIERLISILNRRTKNNPLLIGEAGVGKTAIVEGLALAISKREVPDSLLDKKILSLDLALIVAGSMFRGEFENRLKQIIDEVKQEPNIILFIDELHTMVGAGATTGSLDAANILKPALARGELRAIGATTLAEYKKHIETDAALERRFQPILVEEPSREEAYEILKGLRPNYEKHHSVTITDEALKSAVELSSRYLNDRFLPDKAVDLIDETAAFLRSINSGSKLLRTIKKIESDLESLEQEKTKAVYNQDFPTAIHLNTQKEKLLKQKDDLSTELSKEQKPTHEISSEDIAHTVSMMTKIPLSKLTKTEVGKLANLEKTLKGKVVGQDEAVEEISRAIRRSRAGISNPNRPLGSFVFLGPTGVGKTETAKVLAREVFGDEEALIRVDMSEFMERHNVSRLVGAPAGYVGYGEGGQLTEAVRRKPYSVVLFDELEKANPEVFNILLQILEDGQLTDAQGKKVNFKNTVIIMTSNLGMQELSMQAAKIGFAEKDENKADEQKKLQEEYEKIKDGVMEMMRHEFRPEFLNRIDKIIVFRPLGLKELTAISKLQLMELQNRLLDQQVQLKTSPALVKFIADKSFDPAQGARFVRKNIQELLEDPLAEKIISGTAKSGSIITADLKKDKIFFSIEKSPVRKVPVPA
ncbi:MAG: ATP-dependent Clp protease ATP-binding subunit [Candidatus Doudnabacteria bacterium]|nr:ATP-dependent Clp protease ATP-binding subunit [Candidatus Doudnabacteria bacterium]